MTHLIPAAAADYDWMAGAPSSRASLRLPPGGVESPPILAVLAGIQARLLAANVTGAWMMIHDDEVVGLCGYLRPPTEGEAEIGYGVAQSRRGLGHASRAVAAIIAQARTERRLAGLTAVTDVANPASQAVLRRNGFQEAGRRTHPEDGDQIVWRVALGRAD